MPGSTPWPTSRSWQAWTAPSVGRPPRCVSQAKTGECRTGGDDLWTVKCWPGVADAARIDEVLDPMGPLPPGGHRAVAVLAREMAEHNDGIRRRGPAWRVQAHDEDLDGAASWLRPILEHGQVARTRQRMTTSLVTSSGQATESKRG